MRDEDWGAHTQYPVLAFQTDDDCQVVIDRISSTLRGSQYSSWQAEVNSETMSTDNINSYMITIHMYCDRLDPDFGAVMNLCYWAAVNSVTIPLSVSYPA